MPCLSPSDFTALRAGGTFIALKTVFGERPICLYAGADMPGAQPDELELLATRQHAPGGPETPLRGSLLNEMGTGVNGPAGLSAHRNGRDWAIDLRLTHVQQVDDHSAHILCEDVNIGIAAEHTLSIDPDSGVFTCRTRIENRNAAPLELNWCAAMCIPLDPRFDRLTHFTGRWAGEFQQQETQIQRGGFVHENTSGRTSHDSFPAFIAKTASSDEAQGLAAGFHLAWSGNHRVAVEQHNDGRSFVQMGEMLFPGEICLGQGAAYTTPDVLAAWSENGIGDISQRFHRHLQGNILPKPALSKPRLVHYNTWEAVYFNHDEGALLDLVDKAADVGTERFVLDDGWFGGRRNDRTGLGDWWVSRDVYPAGLHSIAKRIKQRGMEFGLWFEPEMINPDSELYRAHPDWVLGVEGPKTIPSRGQLTLDLTRAEVGDYLFDAITALVIEYGIAYIKWDMNRDTHMPGGSDGRAVMHTQTHAVYALMQRLRLAHPGLEIESCSSGGGRADFGILRHADRIWTSDNNDARSRHSIMRGASHFLPLRVLGNHVGPAQCHITGRRFAMEFRAGSALFGHMGMEMDLREENAHDLAVLKAGIALHKHHRDLIHQGRFIRLPSPAHTDLFGCVSDDQTEALFSYAMLDEQDHTQPQRIHFRGLDPAKTYRIRIVWPNPQISPSPSISAPSVIDAVQLHGKGTIFSGSALMGYGIQPPLIHPDTCLIYHLEAVT